MTAQENLARVIDPATWEDSTLSDHYRLGSLRAADRVVAFLTSDEAIEAGARAFFEEKQRGQLWDALQPPRKRHWMAVYRVSVRAVLGVESLPLDPYPLVDVSMGNRWALGGRGVFNPRPGFEQRREFYEKGAE